MEAEILVGRLRDVLSAKQVGSEEKRMFGGVCFMVDDKMCFGVTKNKESGSPHLIARIGDEAHEEALSKQGCRPFNMTGREMAGFVWVEPVGYASQQALDFWVQLCLDYNPKAKRSKKKARKK